MPNQLVYSFWINTISENACEAEFYFVRFSDWCPLETRA